MNKKSINIIKIVLISIFITILIGGCVSSKDALLLESKANNPIMKNLQDNDQDLVQIEDGSGAIGETTACPT